MKNIRRLQDIQIGNTELIETYRENFDNERIEEAQSIINTNVLKSYVLQAEWMNDVKTQIEELEEYKVTKCDNLFDNKTEEFQFNINEFIYINQYSSSKQYYKNNFVTYNNEIYFCIQNSLNKTPTNTNYWVRIGLRGEKGAYSLGVTYRGFWNKSATYYKYDLVTYKNNLYIARKNNPMPLDDDESSTEPPRGEMNFLNGSLFLGSNTYLKNIWTDWFLLTSSSDELKIYDSPEDYTRLPIYSIFFQKL